MSSRHPIDDAIDRVTALFHREIGLQPESSLQTRVRRCVRDGAAARKVSETHYVDEVMRRGSTFQDLIDEITVQESGFFRHAEQFEVLARDLLPGLDRPVTIWSAGCANGQEALSLAMVLDEQGVPGSVVATDISEAALQRTRLGRYSAREIRGLSKARVERYLRPVGEMWEFDAALRNRVCVVRHNLIDPLPRKATTCHVVFCRNILIYLSPLHIRAFLDRVAEAYPAGTPVFIGAAEVLWQVGDAFEPVRIGNTFFYRLRTDALADRPNPAARPEIARPASVRGRSHPGSSVEPFAPAAQPTTSTATATATDLARTGQAATARGDHQSAVVAFRACAYLTPHDAIAHLHLGLALEATGDRPAATRAFGVARSTLLSTAPALVEQASEGYTHGELLSLLDAKRRVATP